MEKQLLDITSELEGILKQISGTFAVQEEVFVYYTVCVETDDDKANAEEVASLLCEQAEKHKINLEIVVATRKEIEDAKKRMTKTKKSKSA